MTFTIPKIAVSWNTLKAKSHWYYTNAMRDWKQATWVAVRQAKLKPIKQYPVQMHVHATWKAHRRHDIDSLYLKAIPDCLVDMKILVDDDLTHLASVTYTGETGAKEDTLTITITHYDPSS
ncbi:hypothetical protein A2635_05255 [Candidatus Peribacteria bacterium RIFCSPHIGHO2_01_FULL_51_9]|nr:MAG: hypothetical protein A2635_05255 [Candidatus Peribacteria bacterium RIFCSPHIGHO2_01_FULL_51_9]